LRITQGNRIQKALLSTLFLLYSAMIERNRMLWASFMTNFVLIFFDNQCKYRQITSDTDIKRRLENIERIIRSHSTVKHLFRLNFKQRMSVPFDQPRGT